MHAVCRGTSPWPVAVPPLPQAGRQAGAASGRVGSGTVGENGKDPCTWPPAHAPGTPTVARRPAAAGHD